MTIHLKLSGYRMAAECARNALLQKVVDNKGDLGIMPIFSIILPFLGLA